MDRLPQELLCLFCEYLTYAELKQVRLVDRRWEAASTPIVFAHVFVALFPVSLDKLAALSGSRLAKHVITLTLLSDIIPLLSRKMYLSSIDFRPTFNEWLDSLPADEREAVLKDEDNLELLKPYHQLPKHIFSDAQLIDGYAAYQAATRDQTNWRQHGKDALFKECFARLPNVSHARVKRTYPLEGSTNSWPFWQTLRQRILVGPFNWRYYISSRDDLFSGQAVPTLLEAVAFRDSFSGTKPVTTLTIHSANYRSYQPTLSDPEDFHATTASYMQRLSASPDAFANLTELHVHVPTELISYLKFATRLRKLTLSHDEEDPFLVHTLMKDTVWLNLEYLQLSVDIPAALLLWFLGRHAMTLEELYLHDMLVHNVEHVIEQLPKILRLKSICLLRLRDNTQVDQDETSSVQDWVILSRSTDFDAPYEKSVKAYLLGETDERPEIEREQGEVDI